MATSTAEYNHNLKFEIRGGTKNEGGDYERNLIALYAVRLVLDDSVHDIRMAPNVNKYGGLDDIVIRVEYKQRTTKLYLLQLKHKQEPSKCKEKQTKHKKDQQKFVHFKPDGDFSLKKYKTSYHKIKKRISTGEQDDLLKDIALTDIVPCLFTNAVFPKDRVNVIFDERASFSCKALHCSNVDVINTTPGGYHMFQINTERPSFTQYLSSYLFAWYQKSYGKTIEEIEKNLKTFETGIVKKICDCFKNKLKSTIQHGTDFNSILISVRQSVKELFKEVESDLLDGILSKMSHYFCQEYQSAQDDYDKYPSECIEYSEFFERLRLYSGQLNYKEVPGVITSRIEESLGKCTPEVTRELIEYIQNYFEDGRLLVKQQIQRRLLDLMLPLPFPKDDFEERFQVFRMVTNLNDPVQKLMVSQHIKVALQGRKETALCDIVDSSFCQNLKAEFLLNHMGGVVQVGKVLELKCENYIKREFQKVIVSYHIPQQCMNCAFIVSVSKRSDLLHKVQDQVNIIDLRNGENLPNDFHSDSKTYAILISNEGDVDGRAEMLMKSIIVKANTVHYLKEADDLFEWKGSRNKVNSEYQEDNILSRYIFRPEYQHVQDERQGVQEEELLQYFQSALVTIISAEPGMGKSTVLDSLVRYCPSNKWMLKLSLNEWNDDLYDKFDEILKDSLQYIYEKCEGDCKDEFSKEIFGFIKNKNAVIVFIDAFDEISPKYTEKVLKIIHKLEQLEARTWVFSRPTLEERLEKDFNTTAIKILPLREDEIKDYLLKSTKIDKPSLERLLRKMADFMKTPLHLNMFSTILCNDLNWDELQVTDLYEKFITTKCNLYYKKYGINLKINGVANMVLSVENIIKNHQILSLFLIYGEEFAAKCGISDSSEIERLLIEIKENKNHVGLISAVRGSVPIFCHRSFAEYLTAKWLSSNTSHTTFLWKCAELLGSNFKTVRFFFDQIITRQYPLHAAVVDGNLELVRKLCNTSGLVLCDSLNRTPLQLAMNYVNCESCDIEKLCRENEVACKILNEICEHFGNTKAFMTHIDCLGQQSNACTFYFIFERLFLIGCYWGCKAVVMMYLTKNYTFINDSNKYDDNYTAFKFVVQGGHVDCLKLLLLCGAYYDIENIKKLTITYSQPIMLKLLSDVLITFATQYERSEHLWKNFKSDLAYVLKFLIVNNRVCIDEMNSLGFSYRARNKIFSYDNVEPIYLKEVFINERVFNLFLEDTKTKFNNLEEVEEHFNLSRNSLIKEKLNVLERAEVITKMQLSGCTPLCAAAFSGYLNAVKVIADMSSNINANPGDKFIPLHCAMDGGNIKVITWLIKAGANVNQVNCEGNTALAYYYYVFYRKRTGDGIYSRKEMLDVFKLFIDNGADVTSKNPGGKSCFGETTEMKDMELIKLFIECGVCVDYRDNSNEFTALYEAINLGQHEYVKYFLSKGADLNIQICKKTGLDWALENIAYLQIEHQQIINKETVILLMKNNADINYYKHDLNVFVLLVYAVEEKWHDLLDYLIKKLADATETDTSDKLFSSMNIYFWFKLHTTKHKTCDHICKILNERGKNGTAKLFFYAFRKRDEYLMKHFPGGESGGSSKEFLRRTYFQKAVSDEHWETVKLFVENGFAINYVNEFTVLHKVIEADQLYYIKCFLDKGADVNITVDNATLLNLVLQKKKISWKTVSLLVENGADVNCRENTNGYTPLHYAVKENRLDMVQYLMTKQADLTITDDLKQQTPLQLARFLKRKDIADCLFAQEQSKMKETLHL